MSIRNRLTYAFAALMALMLVQLAVTFYYNYRAENESTARIAASLQANTLLGTLQIQGQQLRRYEKEYFIYVGDAAGRAKYAKEWSDTFAKLQAELGSAEKNAERVFAPMEIAEVRSWRLHAGFYGDAMKDIFRKVEEGTAGPSGKPTPVEVNVLIRDGKDRFGVALTGIAAMAAAKTAQASAAALAIRQGFTVTYVALIVTAVLGGLLALRLVRTIPQSIIQPIDELTHATDRMTKGELNSKVSTQGVREFAGLVDAIERMRVAQQMMLQRLQQRRS